MLRRLFVSLGAICPVKFRVRGDLPTGCVIRATPRCLSKTAAKEIVTRCPNHIQQFPGEGHAPPSHLIRCQNVSCRYETSPVIRRESVVVPFEGPFSIELYQLTCFSSCTGGIGRRSIEMLFTLEHGLVTMIF